VGRGHSGSEVTGSEVRSSILVLFGVAGGGIGGLLAGGRWEHFLPLFVCLESGIWEGIMALAHPPDTLSLSASFSDRNVMK